MAWPLSKLRLELCLQRPLAAIEAAMQRPPSEAEAARRAFVKVLDPHLCAFYSDWTLPDATDPYRSFNARC